MIERIAVEDLFPLDSLHNHSACVVETPDGGLLTCWYRGSGERTADDVRILGARKPKGGRWSKPFVLADTPGFPDTNPVLAVDARGRLWLFHAVQIANTWESTLLRYRRARDWGRGDRAPRWEKDGVVLLRPDDTAFQKLFRDRLAEAWQPAAERATGAEKERLGAYLAKTTAAAQDKLTRRLGWFGRCHAFAVGERMVLPLYSDGFDASLFAWTDDDGESWACSLPILGPAPVQPSVLRRRDGTLVAYCRNNGPAPQRVLVSESHDDARSWTLARHIGLPNPGSSVEGVVLADGRWLLCGNDTEEGRHSLALWLSDDEGRTWSDPIVVERADRSAGLSWHYPSLIQSKDRLVHLVCSHFTPGGKTMRHFTYRV